MMQRRPLYFVLLAIFVILLAGWFFTGDGSALSSARVDPAEEEDWIMPSELPLSHLTSTSDSASASTSTTTTTSTPTPDPNPNSVPPPGQALDGPALLAGNDTLGFQKILALSERPTWRTRGLRAAANLTNLDIVIPPKPPVDDRLAKSFSEIDKDNGYDHPAFGASRAWLSHLDIIKYVYQSNIQTALILEDDADWDIAIRDQLQNLSTAARQLIKPAENDSTPYTRDWDVLWIGHCGAVWGEDRETVRYHDANIPPRDHYKSYRKGDIESIPEEERIVFRSAGPICTYAYAVTHRGAGKILAGMGAGQGEAFDVEMSWECDRGHLKCLAVVPELVNEYTPPPEYNVKSFVAVGNGADAGSKEEEFESRKGGSGNIVHSSRCQALWQEDCRSN